MHIVSFLAENVKKLTVVKITPQGNMVEITGKNGQGKTSVLDCLWWALEGAKHIQAQPIRKGQKRGRIVLGLGEGKTAEYIVERRFTEKGGSITVENAEGLRHPSPQSLLDSLIGSLSFDPLAFTRMKPKAQFDMLASAVKLPIDLEELEAKNKSDFTKRTDINRDARTARAGADAIDYPSDLPEAPVDVAALSRQLEDAGKHNTSIEERRGRRQGVMDEIDRLRDSAASLRQQADDAEKKAAEYEKKLKDAEPLPEWIDTAPIREQIDAAAKINDGIAKRQRALTLAATADKLEAEAKALTEAMEARTKAKQDAIAAADMPVMGLGFGDGFVTLDGVPFEQASKAQQIKVSMSIAMAANPKLKVIRIEDGSLLDEDTWAQISTLAEAQDFQVWVETVRPGSKMAIELEDGHVKGAEPAEIEA